MPSVTADATGRRVTLGRDAECLHLCFNGNPFADRPVAGTTRASMSGAGSNASADDGRGASRCRQSEPFRRLGANQRAGWTPAVHAATDLSLPKTPEAAILAPRSTRNRRDV